MPLLTLRRERLPRLRGEVQRKLRDVLGGLSHHQGKKKRSIRKRGVFCIGEVAVPWGEAGGRAGRACFVFCTGGVGGEGGEGGGGGTGADDSQCDVCGFSCGLIGLISSWLDFVKLTT